MVDKVNVLSGTASLNLFKGGSDYFTLQNTSFQNEVAANTTRAKHLEVELEGALALFTRLEAAKNVYLQELILDMAQKNNEVANQRFRAGLISKTDTLKAEVELNNQSAAALQASERLASTQSSLDFLFQNNSLPNDWPWFDNKSESVTELKQKISSLALDITSRPDLLALKNLEGQLGAQKKALIGNFLPRLDLALTRNMNEYQTNRSWETVGVLTMTFSLFNRFSDYSNYTILANQSLGAEYETRFQTQKSQAEADALKDLLLINLDNVIKLQKNLKLAQELYQESLGRFKRGQSSYSDLALDLERYLRAEQLLLAQTSSAHKQIAQLCYSLGKSQIQCL